MRRRQLELSSSPPSRRSSTAPACPSLIPRYQAPSPRTSDYLPRCPRTASRMLGEMADRRDVDFTYSLTDRIIRLSLGELPDFSGAKFDGDFSLGLEEAQRRKHDYVAEQVGIGPGRRLLDLGCGWGPLLAYTRERGGDGGGVTLSSAQLAVCRQHGLELYLEDARDLERDRFGPFDAVASLGA